MKQVLGVFLGHGLTTRWRLGRASAISLSALIAVSLLYCALSITQTPPLQYPGDSLLFRLHGTQVFLLPLTAVAASCYIYVGAKAERPSQLHAHGLALFLMLATNLLTLTREVLWLQDRWVPGTFALSVTILSHGVGKAMIVLLIKQKIMALGPPQNCCVHAQRWGNTVAGFILVMQVAAFFAYGWLALMLSRGVSLEAAVQATSFGASASGVSVADHMVLRVCISVMGVCALGMLVANSGFLYCAFRMSRRIASKLLERGVAGEVLAGVRRTVGQHLLGSFLTIVSTQLQIVAALADSMRTFPGQDADIVEQLPYTLPFVIDAVGDVAGILLLSGIGTLLFREDPEAGNAIASIRGVLHSAVSTGRVERAFEGNVEAAPRGSLCVVSFPGKFFGDWQAMTWACEQGDISSACVFLPASDPQKRFGQHAERKETPRQCWCHSIYGSVQPWGCLWFTAWQSNVKRAVELNLELVVVFFPGELGRGMVAFENLGKVDLWDGTGLGASQKAEVAYLRTLGLPLTELDLEGFRQRVRQTSAARASA